MKVLILLLQGVEKSVRLFLLLLQGLQLEDKIGEVLVVEGGGLPIHFGVLRPGRRRRSAKTGCKKKVTFSFLSCLQQRLLIEILVPFVSSL